VNSHHTADFLASRKNIPDIITVIEGHLLNRGYGADDAAKESKLIMLSLSEDFGGAMLYIPKPITIKESTAATPEPTWKRHIADMVSIFEKHLLSRGHGAEDAVNEAKLIMLAMAYYLQGAMLYVPNSTLSH